MIQFNITKEEKEKIDNKLSELINIVTDICGGYQCWDAEIKSSETEDQVIYSLSILVDEDTIEELNKKNKLIL